MNTLKMFEYTDLKINEAVKEVYGRMVVTERIVEHPFVFANLNQGTNTKILDVGCSHSLLSLELASLGFDVTGYDLDEYPFTHPNLEFIRGNFIDNEFEDGLFDTVISISTLEHCGLEVDGSPIFDDGDYKVVNEIARVLRDGGTFIISVPFGIKGETPGYRVYDYSSLSDIFLKCGLKIKIAQYFVGFNRNYWVPSTVEEIAEVDSIIRRYPQGVACVVTEK